jgi:senataxin
MLKPGTGKTFTLIGIVSGLYHYIKHSTSTYKRYIMICAPSNAAIDEIITRIKKKGLIDENGNSAKPQLIRIGVLDNNPSDIVKNVSLEHLAQEVLFNQEKLSMKKDQSTAVEIRQILERLNAKIEKIKKECDDPNNQQTKKILDALFDRKRRLNFDYHQVKQNKLNYKVILFCYNKI